MMNHSIIDFVRNPYLIFNWIAAKHLMDWMDDKTFLKLRYRASFGKKLNLEHPVTFNEKLQWLKLYNRMPEYTIMVDKVKAKDYVAKLIGAEHIIPTLGVWDSPDEIDFDSLPNQFVLKCNHNSGLGMCICRDKSTLDISEVKKALWKGLKEDYYLQGREWPYKNVPRKILAEKYMVDSEYDKKAIGKEDLQELTDYKFFCFGGEPFMMYVSHDHAEHATTDFFDMNYKLLPIRMKDPNSENPPAYPKEFEEMKQYARMLSKNIPHLRVDFYVINHHVYFGEMTFFHNAAFSPVKPASWEIKLGNMINLPKL